MTSMDVGRPLVRFCGEERRREKKERERERESWDFFLSSNREGVLVSCLSAGCISKPSLAAAETPASSKHPMCAMRRERREKERDELIEMGSDEEVEENIENRERGREREIWTVEQGVKQEETDVFLLLMSDGKS